MKVLNQEKLDRMAKYIKSYMRSNNGEMPKFGEILAHMEANQTGGISLSYLPQGAGIIEYSGKGMLKHIFWENGRPCLHVENKGYTAQQRDIYPKELSIQGVALKLIKDF